MNRNTKWLIWLISLSALLLIVVIVSSGIGVADISPVQIIRIISSRLPFVNIEKDWDDNQELALMEWRLPRILIGVIVGGRPAQVGSQAGGSAPEIERMGHADIPRDR